MTAIADRYREEHNGYILYNRHCEGIETYLYLFQGKFHRGVTLEVGVQAYVREGKFVYMLTTYLVKCQVYYQ